MAKLSRLVFQYRSRYFKLVDIEWGDDNSFYFLPCQHEAEIGTRLKTEIDESGNLNLKLNEVETNRFPTRKISRHSSGYIHIKDVIGSKGKRETDGLIGPAFKDVAGFYVFLLVFPQKIDSLVETEMPSATDMLIELPNSIEPFSVQFAVFDKKAKIKIPMSPGEYLGDGVIQVTHNSQEYGMIVMLANVQKTKSELVLNFPARTCYIVR